MTTQPQAHLAIAIQPAAGGAAPEWVQLLPAGRFDGATSQGQGPWRLDDAAAVIAASKPESGRLVVDYDHQTDWAIRPGVGGTAKAAGWIAELAPRADGIWGRVEWTGAGGQAVAAREYRFLSPVFAYDKASGRVLRLLRASLTNNPAFEMTALASRSGQENDMDLTKIAQALGLAEDAGADAIAAKASELAARAGTALGTIAEAAGLKTDTDAATLATAVKALAAKAAASGDPAQFVPRSQYDQLAARVEKLETDGRTSAAATAVDAAIAAGKLAPASKEWGLAYAAKDAAGFEAFVGSAPVVVEPGGRTATANRPPAEKGKLSPEEKAICAQLGLTEADFLKTRDAEVAA